jgi:hypothetical protein
MRRPIRVRLYGFLASALLVSALLASASHAATMTIGRLDPGLEKCPFGQGVDAVTAWVRGRLEAVYAPRIAGALDRAEKDRLKAAIEADLTRFRQAEAKFDGTRTGYEVSVIDREFVAGAGESLFVYQEGNARNYLFLTDGKLWKVGVLLAPDVDFETRVRDLGKKLGLRATSFDNALGRAEWLGEALRVSLLFHRQVYQADLLTVSSVPLLASVDTRRKEAREKAAAQEPTEDGLKGVLEGKDE